MQKIFLPALTTIIFYFFPSGEIVKCVAQNPLVKQWDSRFGGTNGELLFSFQQTSDRGYILGGFSVSGISGDKTQPNWDTICNPACTVDYWIVKTDSLGIKQWEKDIGGTGGDALFSLKQTNDGGYILGGYSESDSSGDKTQPLWDTCLACYKSDYWIVKTDSLGNKQWDKDFGGTGRDYLYSIRQTTDGGYILGGSSWSGIGGDKTQPTWGSSDYWIVKIDSSGNKQWDKDYGGTSNDFLISLQQTNDGGYILAGHSYSDSSGDKTQNTWGSYGADYWIVKIDSLGTKQWDKDFGGTDEEDLTSILQTADGGYIIAGSSASDSSGDRTQPNWDQNCNPHCSADYWIVKTDSIGNKQWDKRFGGNLYDGNAGLNFEEAMSIIQTGDGGYLVAGTSSSNLFGSKTEDNLGQRQTWLVKTNKFGNKKWDKTIFTDGFDQSGIALQTNDGCYVIANFTTGGIAGYKTQPAWGGNDYWIIKFCDSTLTTNIQSAITNHQFAISIYPNPADEFLVIRSPFQPGDEIQLSDMLGKLLFTTKIKTPASDFRLPISHFSPGIYFLKAGNEVKKFVKQ